MTTVVLVDDQALLREGIRLILESQPDLEVVAEAADGAEALAVCAEHRPDVVLMDLRMPGMDGVTATARLTAREPAPRVLVLTTFDQDADVHAALRAGASGFLVKTARAEELIAAVRAAAEGRMTLAPGVTQRLAEDFATAPAPAADGVPASLTALTDRELEVLRLITRGRSNTEIAGDLHLGESTVKTHVARIFSKLGLRDRAEAIVLGYESGLVRPGH